MSEVPIIINYKDNRLVDSDRRANRFRIDWSLNITSILAILALIITMVRYGSMMVEGFKETQAKTTIMWNHFDKTQINQADLEVIQKLQ